MNEVVAPNTRIPVAVCAAVAEVLVGSHQTLEELFLASGVPGPAPDLSHQSKWKVWLQRAGNDPKVDSLAVLGNLIEEFMDLPPASVPVSELFGVRLPDPLETYIKKKERLVQILEQHGFRYYRGGRVLPIDVSPQEQDSVVAKTVVKPDSVEELLSIIIRGLPRAMHPLTHRRKGVAPLVFESEYDIQDLLHSHIRPWIGDIRPEEYTPSYAGTSTRMDFLLPEHGLVLEIKRIRDKNHASKVGDELIIDVEHYRRHEACKRLWGVIYDPQHLLVNPAGLARDLEGLRRTPDGEVEVKIFIVGAS
ncbi:MAG TPA: transposase [Gammaproteobacteria bacterium]